MVNTAAAVAAAGSAILIADYIDRKIFLTRDIGNLRRLLPAKRAMSTVLGEWSVADMWADVLKGHQKHPAIVFEGKTLTFGDIDAISNRLANFYLSRGFKKGDVGALYMENRPEYLIAWLAMTKIGVTVAHLNCNLVGKALTHCLTISNAKFVIFGHESISAIETVQEAFAAQGVRFACWGAALPWADHIDAELPKCPADPIPKTARKGIKGTDIWGFVYTSGTTGLPKAAVIKHMRFFTAGTVFANLYDVTDQDKIYTVLPLYHSAGGMIGVGMMFSAGATMYLRRKFSAKHFISDIREHGCTVFQYIGELCRYLMATPPSPQDKQHKIRVAIGNGLRPDIWEKFQTRFAIPEIGEFYAATEGNASLFNRVDMSGFGRGGIGHMGWLLSKLNPVKIVKFDVETEEVIRGKDGRCIECKPNEVGELIGYIDPADPTRDYAGYYNNKSGSEKKVLTDVFAKGDRWFRTGDLLKKDADGFFYFVDRIGDTFRWKGENVSTNEVAEAIATFPGIQEANVYGVQIPEKDGRAGAAGLVILKGAQVDFDALGAHVAKELPSYAIPLFLRILPEMELTGTFKHRKVELRNEGIDLSKIKDPMYFFDAATKKYIPYTDKEYQAIITGKAKL